MMLFDDDIEFIKQSRREMRFGRESTVLIKYKVESDPHPVTGEVEYEYRHETLPWAIITPIVTDATEGRELYNGVFVYNGDIVVDINIEDMPDGIIHTDIISFSGVENYVDPEDTYYKVMNSVMLGLGEINRVELLGRSEK